MEKKSPHQEWIGKKGIEMHLYPGRIANDLKNQTTDQGCQVSPVTVANADQDLEEKKQGKDSEVEGVAGKGRDISDLCILDRTSM